MYIGIGMGVGLGGGVSEPTIDAWQAEGSVVAGGLEAAKWDNATASGAISITMLMGTAGMRHATTIKSIKLHVNTRTGATWKFKLFRWDGSTYNMVGSHSFVPAGTGAQTITIPDMAAELGDFPAIWHPATEKATLSNTNYNGGTNYAIGEITTSDVFAGITAPMLEMEVYGTRPYLAITGDSIIEGNTKYNSFLTGYVTTSNRFPGEVAAGDIEYETGYQLRQIKSNLRAANCAKAGKTFTWVLSTGIPSAIAANPYKILIHCGINDLNTGRTWAQVESDLDAIKALTGSIKLYIDELLPWTNGSDAGVAIVRTWNANLAAWCVTNNATLVHTHDGMGQIRASTGELDDLVTAYNLDGVHITKTGTAALAALIAPSI